MRLQIREVKEISLSSHNDKNTISYFFKQRSYEVLGEKTIILFDDTMESYLCYVLYDERNQVVVSLPTCLVKQNNDVFEIIEETDNSELTELNEDLKLDVERCTDRIDELESLLDESEAQRRELQNKIQEKNNAVLELIRKWMD